MTATSDIFLWIVVPYVCLTVFVLGHLWRYRHDKFGWTSRSSQIHESRLLRLGSPLFHFGILAVLAGHVGGLLVPKNLTSAAGVSDGLYHWVALGMGTLSGLAALAGIVILLYRRLTVPAVSKATTTSDKIMYLMLLTVMLSGLGATLLINGIGDHHDYRETVAPWFRSVFYFQPDAALMTSVPLGFQLHALSAWALVALWPFTRLVHVLSAPVGYLWRPYVVYRSRDPRSGIRAVPRGWDLPG